MMHIHAFYMLKDPWSHMFGQAVITVTSISMGLCPAAWAEQALLTLDMGAGEWKMVQRAHSPTDIGTGEQHLGFWTVAAGLQKGEFMVAVDQKKKIWLIFLLFFPRGLATLLNPGAIRERKILLNLAIAVLIIFFAPSKPAQPLMSHNWLLSAPNLFTEVRINF